MDTAPFNWMEFFAKETYTAEELAAAKDEAERLVNTTQSQQRKQQYLNLYGNVWSMALYPEKIEKFKAVAKHHRP